MSAAPPLGLLLDVDGPVASPETRTVPAGLLADLRALLAAGIPVALNTGRSAAFVAEQVVGPLVAGGLPGRARLHAVCEKGGVWATAGAGGLGDEQVDPGLAVPAVCRELLAGLVDDGYGDIVFLDGTKRVMATVEARTDVPAEVYARRRQRLDAEVVAGLTAAGLGVRVGDDEHPDAGGRTPWRVDPSVIATDVESADSGKALGARRALDLLGADGPLPRTWHTVGDSRSDYAMAAHLHAAGHEVVHVDVGPEPPLHGCPHPVTTVRGLRYTDAGAAHLRALADRLAR